MSQISDAEGWLDQYGDFLFRYAFLRLRDPMLAEDMVQETLLAALRARDMFSGKSSEKTWLTGILKHKIVDHLRRAYREQPLEDDTMDSPGSANDAFDADGRWRADLSQWMEPDKSLEQQEFWAVFYDCVKRLPPRLADVLILRELEDLGTDEICKDLGITTTNNLWVMLSRARMRMRDCLNVRWFSRKSPQGRT